MRKESPKPRAGGSSAIHWTRRYIFDNARWRHWKINSGHKDAQRTKSREGHMFKMLNTSCHKMSAERSVTGSTGTGSCTSVQQERLRVACSTEPQSKAHSGEVGTCVLAGIAVEHGVEIVHSAHLARPLAWGALVHSTKTTSAAAGERAGIFSDVAHIAAQFGSAGKRFSLMRATRQVRALCPTNLGLLKVHTLQDQVAALLS